MPVNVAPKKGGLFLSLGLLRNQGIGFERILSVSLMVGAICAIIGVSICGGFLIILRLKACVYAHMYILAHMEVKLCFLHYSLIGTICSLDQKALCVKP